MDTGISPWTPSSPKLAPLAWEELCQSLYPSAEDRPSAPSNLASLLSSSSYALPDAPSHMDSDSEPPSQLLYGATDRVLRSSLSQRQKTPREATTKASSKKAGRPRKNTDLVSDKDAKEKRRRQVRLAQRAYRSRNAANIDALKARVAQLEDAVQKMSEAVISFSDIVVHSGALAEHTSVANRLREMLQKCLLLAKEVSSDRSQESPQDPPPAEEESLLSFTPELPLDHPGLSLEQRTKKLVALKLSLPKNCGIFHPGYPSSLFSINVSEAGEVDMAVFAEQLRLACIYNGLVMLTNPSSTLEVLKRPFRMLLSLLNREAIGAYFEAAFNARLNRKTLEGFHDMPFFQLGGAGTHYPRVYLESDIPNEQPARPQHYRTIHPPVSELSTAVQEELDGKWFDLQDLLGYLGEKEVRMHVFPPADRSARAGSSSHVVNAVCFITALVSRAICLGRSPGFRQIDVDKALGSATWL